MYIILKKKKRVYGQNTSQKYVETTNQPKTNLPGVCLLHEVPNVSLEGAQQLLDREVHCRRRRLVRIFDDDDDAPELNHDVPSSVGSGNGEFRRCLRRRRVGQGRRRRRVVLEGTVAQLLGLGLELGFRVRI
jgi:hypothetical protein